jgi:hypothetical protein
MPNIDTFNTDDIEVVDIDDTEQTEVVRLSFDVNAIQVKSQPMNVGQLSEMLQNKMIDLYMDFHRSPYLWDDIKQSQFIESIILNLPVPLFYFFEAEDGRLEIVDGLQRISTIKRFVIDDDLVLQGLEFNETYNGKRFSELPAPIKWRIKLLSLSVSILQKGTPKEAAYLLFKRLNVGGLPLTSSEMRNAIYRNGGAQLIAELSQSENEYEKNTQRLLVSATEEGKLLAKVTHNQLRPERMQNREWVTRFLAFYLIPYTKYKDNSLDLFLNNGVKAAEKLSDSQKDKLKADFRKAMNTAHEIFGEYAFRKMSGKNEAKKPISIALFEALSVCFAKCTEEECRLLIERKEEFQDEFIKLHNKEDKKFFNAITDGTAKNESVRLRFENIQSIIKTTLE